MRPKNSKRKVEAMPVRVPASAYERLQQLANRAARDGWKSLGSDRSDLPTMAAVIDEALIRLAGPSR